MSNGQLAMPSPALFVINGEGVWHLSGIPLRTSSVEYSTILVSLISSLYLRIYILDILQCVSEVDWCIGEDSERHYKQAIRVA
jgi:hypothetical protein